MASFNVWPSALEPQEWTAEGGEALPIMQRETLEPTNPSNTQKLKSSSKGPRFLCLFKGLPAALNTALEGGEVVTGVTFHVNMNASSKAKSVQLAIVKTLEVLQSGLPEMQITQGWFTLALSEAQATALNKAGLEALTFRVIKETATATSAYECYMTVTTEAGAAPHGAITQTVGAAASTTGQRIAQAAVTRGMAAAPTASGQRLARGATSQAAAANVQRTGQKLAQGAETQAAGASVVRTGDKLAQGTAAQPAAASQATTAGPSLRRASISQAAAAAQRTVASGHLVAGALAQAVAARQASSAQRIGQGAATQGAGASQAVSARRIGQGALAQAAGVRQATTATRRALGALTQAAGIRQATTAFQRVSGAILQRLGIAQAPSARKPVVPLKAGPPGIGETSGGTQTGVDLASTTGESR